MSDVVAVGIYLLNSTYTSDKYFNCSEDVCLIGRDYCDTFHHRCALCSDHEENCFTNRQQQNCTQFCMDGWTKKQQANCGLQNDECSVWKYIAIGESCILFLMVIMLIIYLMRSRLKFCFGRCYRNLEDGPAKTKQTNGTDLPKIDSVEDLLKPDDPIANDSTSIISPSVNDTCSCFAVYVLLAISMLGNVYSLFVWCRSNQVPCGPCKGVSDHIKSNSRPGTNGASNVIRRKKRGRKKRRRNRDYAKKNDPETEAKFFECHAMACLIGTQFCNAFWKRCDDCLLYEKDCFTSQQQPNCTVFCQEKWLIKQRKMLKSEKCKTGEGQYAALPWIVATAVLAVFLLACGCVLLRDKIRSSVRWLGLELSKCGGKYQAESKGVHICASEGDKFILHDKRLAQEQQRTCTKPSIEGAKQQAQPSDVYRTLDPNSIYSDRTNKKNAPLPRPETDFEN